MKNLLLSLSVFLLPFVSGTVAFASSQIVHWTTDNGARVYFVETHQIPMVQFALGFDAGSARDPASAPGLSYMVKSMLEEGAADLDADTISAGFESVGAEYSAGSGRDVAIFELRSLSEPAILDQAMGVFGKVIRLPSFPPDAMERIRERTLIGLERSRQSPRGVSSRVFYEALYKDHPYAHSPLGREESIRRITRQDLVDFHREFYVGENAVAVIVGALTPEQARALAAEIVGSLPPGKKPTIAWKKFQTQRPATGAEAVDVSFPSSQTHLLMGQEGIARDDPDYFPLYVGNHILGGNGLISRLANTIREERGLAYSVYSSFSPMKQRGPFIINLQTRNDQAELAEELSIDVLRRFIDTGPDPGELEAAKGNIVGGFPLRLSSNGKIADNVMSIAFYGLPLDYLDTFSERIEAVDLEQVKSAFRRRIQPDRFLTVRVGGG